MGVLGIELWTSCLLSTYSTAELYNPPQPPPPPHAEGPLSSSARLGDSLGMLEERAALWNGDWSRWHQDLSNSQNCCVLNNSSVMEYWREVFKAIFYLSPWELLFFFTKGSSLQATEELESRGFQHPRQLQCGYRQDGLRDTESARKVPWMPARYRKHCPEVDLMLILSCVIK